MKTISQATMEEILTSPDPHFTVDEVWQRVQDSLGCPINKGAVGNYITYVWQKKGITKRISDKNAEPKVYIVPSDKTKILEKMLEASKKKTWKAPPTGGIKHKLTSKPVRLEARLPDTIDSLQIGNAIIDKINALQQEIVDLKHKLIDAKVLHDADIKAYSQQLKGKDMTISELKRDIERLKKANEVKRRTVPLSEIAVIK